MKNFPRFYFCCSEPDTNDLENIDMEYIINKYGSFSGYFSRPIDFGGETSKQSFIYLIVSDCDKSRGQKESFLSTEIIRTCKWWTWYL